MRIGGFIKSSLIEFPGMISAVIFTQGCNFRCPYCHNPELVEPDKFSESIPVDEILGFLKERRGLLDGVVIGGGEPTLNSDLPQFIMKIKELGFPVKLDTNGSNPRMIRDLIDKKMIDFVAMDIKAPLEKYSLASGVVCDTDRIKASIMILSNSNINVEFRTTALDNLHTEEDIIKISELIPEGNRFCLQRFEPHKTLDTSYLNKKTLSENTFDWLQEKFKRVSLNFAVR